MTLVAQVLSKTSDTEYISTCMLGFSSNSVKYNNN